MPDSLPYRLASSPGKGLGMYATRPIAIGDLVVSEAPLFIASSDSEVDLAVAGLSREDKAIFFAFTDSHLPDSPTPATIFRSNALPAGPDAGGMYTLISRINHSCLPNVHHIWSDALQHQVVYARTDIPEGAEILDAYIPHNRSRKMRQSHITQIFNFTCGCPYCSGPVNKESDVRRERIHKLDALHTKITLENPAVALRYVKERLRLMDEEGLHDLGERAADHFSGAKIGAVCSDFDVVRRQMGLAYAHRRLYAGPEDERANEMLAVYREPRTHVLAGIAERDRILPSICDGCGEQEAGGFEGDADGGGECKGCRCAIYCSSACREAGEPRHKPICDVLRVLAR